MTFFDLSDPGQCLEAMAELIAEGVEPAEAGLRLGFSTDAAREVWLRIQADFGEQSQ